MKKKMQVQDQSEINEYVKKIDQACAKDKDKKFSVEDSESCDTGVKKQGQKEPVDQIQARTES